MHAILRPWRPADAAALARALASTPDLDSQFGVIEASDVRAVANLLESRLCESDTSRNWAIVLDGDPVGNVGLSHIERRHDTAWVSYWLSQSARGHGLASRAVAAVARHAFGELDLFRLELGHRVNNPASCQVATTAGFLAEGIERAKLRYGDDRFDVETHARLRTDARPLLGPIEIE